MNTRLSGFLLLLSLSLAATSQAQITELTDKMIINRMKSEFGDQLNLKPDSSIQRRYFHLEGTIGGSHASIELNMQLGYKTAYIYCDSADAISGFDVHYNNGFVILTQSDQFLNIYDGFAMIILAETKRHSFIGYACNLKNKRIICAFKEDYSKGQLDPMEQFFKYDSTFKKFPVYLSATLLFADSSFPSKQRLNKLLIDQYDRIGQNYDIDESKFKDLEQFRNADNFKKYCTSKFIRFYKKAIDNSFITDAKESGHTDILSNDIRSQILWNDGHYIVFQIMTFYSDGIGYPYYTTEIFEFDLKNRKQLTADVLNTQIRSNKNFEEDLKISLRKHSQNDDEDDWSLSFSEAAFPLDRGVVLYKTGGNHGIQFFYRYIPNRIIKPLLK